MSAQRLLALALATLGGVAVGWLVKPEASHAHAAGETTELITRRGIRPSGNEDSRIAARWMERMGTAGWENVEKVAEDIPTGEIGAVLNGLLDGIWGSLSNEELTRIGSLIMEWVKRDPEGALAWARNLEQPQQRELGLSWVAAAIGQEDPEKGFEIYTELDQVTLHLNSGLLHNVTTVTFTNAAKLGPEALLDAMKRMPESVERSSMGLRINYPQDFDFAALLDGMSDAGFLKLDHPSTKPYMVDGILGEWALRDGNAAFSYLAEHASEGTYFKFHDLTAKIAETEGTAKANAWLGEKLVALDSAQRQELVKGSMLRYGADNLNNFIVAMPTEEAATEFRYDILQATGEFGFGRSYGILNEMPDMEDRLAVIERLQNVKNTEALVDQLREWKVPQERIDGIVEKVKRKE